MSKSEEYWRKREEEQRKKNIEDEEEYAERIKYYYRQEMNAIEDRIYAFYVRYSTKEGITMAEARRRVSKMDVEEFAETAAKYVKEKDFSDRANEELRLYNLTMRVNYQQLLMYQIAMESCATADELEQFMKSKLEGRTIDEIKRQAGILGESLLDQADMVHSIVNASFHNATFSDRIWANQAMLRANLSNILTNALVQGRNPRDYIKDIRKIFDVSRGQAERLLRTELARVQSEAQLRSYEKAEFDEYIFHALGDACPVCAALDGEHFKVKDAEPGINISPMHPNCRCSTGPYMDTEDFDEWLAGIDEHGLTFEEWKTVQSEKRRKPSTENQSTALSDDIQSPEYKKSFNALGEDAKLTYKIYRKALDMLKHRDGTEYEDLTYISSKINSDGIYQSFTNRRLRQKNSVFANEVMKNFLTSSEKDTVIALHNHPNGTVPSLDDLKAARKYKYGLIVGHNGKIFKYSVDSDVSNQTLKKADIELEFLNRYLYDTSRDHTDHIVAKIEQLRELGVEFEVIR